MCDALRDGQRCEQREDAPLLLFLMEEQMNVAVQDLRYMHRLNLQGK
jgi:hypothetical protein